MKSFLFVLITCGLLATQTYANPSARAGKKKIDSKELCFAACRAKFQTCMNTKLANYIQRRQTPPQNMTSQAGAVCSREMGNCNSSCNRRK